MGFFDAAQQPQGGGLSAMPTPEEIAAAQGVFAPAGSLRTVPVDPVPEQVLLPTAGPARAPGVSDESALLAAMAALDAEQSANVPVGELVTGGGGGPLAQVQPGPVDERRALAEAVLSAGLSQGGGGGGRGRRVRLLEDRANQMVPEAAAAGQDLGQARTELEVQQALAQEVVGEGVEQRAQHFETLAEIERQSADTMRDMAELRQAQREQDRARLDDLGMALDKEWQDIAATEVRDSRSVGDRTLAAIGIALGAIGQGLMSMGGDMNAKNQAVDIVNASIERSLQVQQQNLENRAKANQSRGGILDRMRQRFLDDEAAFKAATGVQQMQVASIAREAGLKQQSEEARQAFAEYAMEMEAQAQANEVAALEAYLGSLRGQMSALDDRAFEERLKGLGRGRNKLIDKLAERGFDYLLEGGGDAQDLGVNGLSEVGKGPTTPKDRERAQQIASEVMPGLQAMDQLISLGDQMGRDPDPATRAEAEQLALASVGVLIALANSGTLNEGEREVYLEIVQDPTRIFQARSLESLKRMRPNIRSQLSQKLQPFGYKFGGSATGNTGRGAGGGAGELRGVLEQRGR